MIETRVDLYRQEDVTKTAAGLRTIPLAASLVEMLCAWQLKTPFGALDDLVFRNRAGSYESHTNMLSRKFSRCSGRPANAHLSPS